MPIKKICQHIGCTRLVGIRETYCNLHKPTAKDSEADRQRSYDKSIRKERDKKERAFYNSTPWKAAKRKAMEIYGGLCLWSYYKDGLTIAATEVHHIEPIKERWDLRLDMSNLVPLSHQAHMWIERQVKSGNKEIKNDLKALKRRWDKEFRGGRGL